MTNRHLIQAHPCHLVDPSPWPLYTSYALLALTIGAASTFHGSMFGGTTLILGLASTILAMGLWFRDVTVEATLMGAHTRLVQRGLSLGVWLFVATEALFFTCLFWAYLHSALSPTVELGASWPPVGIEIIDPYQLLLLNTLLLLASGVAVTWGHHAFMGALRGPALIGLGITFILAVIFTACQALEYATAPLSIADSVYGSSFYLATGFHGLHVIVGTVFILVSTVRLYLYHPTNTHHVGLEGGGVLLLLLNRLIGLLGYLR